ncbi:ABC transporter ATP-binding protein [Pseudomonas matsuisoli]|uniref:Histidinol-phosphatase n=1 Tax=Pseudomonas matsuisoli TaxID=1515666 RepID=A0A917PV74_9PSED|nr:ABC transporter ATP-binding protein [Pseudomonas matsuisoli]GGJ93056.1 histidinol-phosphatase [Pseudomonas matsuisoli]
MSDPLTTNSEIVLECQALGYAVRETWLVRDISLSIARGERIGIVGPNGSGKSTLLKLLAGIMKPREGQVQLMGRALQGLNRREIAQTLAFVEQQADTLDAISVQDAVELGRTPWLSPVQPWSERDDEVVRHALQDVALAHLSTRAWKTLSGGERQRVHIARALAQTPQVLLLDEPTNHLDIRQQLALLKLVHGLPVTTVMALHDLNQALTCDRLAVMSSGRLVALGPPHDVLTPQQLQNTFGVAGRWLIDPVDGARMLRLEHLSEQERETHD